MKKIIRILVCMLLIVNVSTISVVFNEKVNSNAVGTYYTFEDSTAKREIKFIKIDDTSQNSLPKKIINNADDNLIPNPSFEEGDTLPIGWSYKTNTNSIFNWDSNFAHSGEKSVGVLNITNITTDSWSLCWISDFIPVDFNEYAYKLSGWIRIIGEPLSPCQEPFIGYLNYDVNYQNFGGAGYGGWSNFSEWGYFNFKVPLSIQDYKNMSKVKYVKIYLGQIYYIGCTEQPDPLVEVRFDDLYLGILTKRPTNPTCRYDKKNKELVVSSTDADGDQIRYGVAWNRTNSLDKWTDFYNSGDEVRIDCKGRNGPVIVFAEDIYGASSMARFSIKSKDKSLEYPILKWLFYRFSIHFSFLLKILNQVK